jgi:hypothetical protein
MRRTQFEPVDGGATEPGRVPGLVDLRDSAKIAHDPIELQRRLSTAKNPCDSTRANGHERALGTGPSMTEAAEESDRSVERNRSTERPMENSRKGILEKG